MERRDPMVHGASTFPPGNTPLPPEFYARPASDVARDLLGCIVGSTLGGTPCSGVLVEVEAYLGPEDEASHASTRVGRTTRNAAMFGPPGLAYVYRIYGIHWCVNTVTGDLGHPSAVLLRAARPLEGVEVARARRPGRPDRDLMRGPGNLCSALGVTGALNHHPLQDPPLQIFIGERVSDELVARGPRIGVTRAADLPLRFWLRGDPWVSKSAG